MEAIEVAGPHFSAAGEGETSWFLQNRMTVRATAETTGDLSRAAGNRHTIASHVCGRLARTQRAGR